MRTMKDIVKRVARGTAALAVLPALVSFAVRRRLMGADRALQGSTQLLSLVPGLAGQYLRRAFLARAIEECHAGAVVEFGTIFSRAGARLGPDAYVGPRCCLGLVEIGAGALLAPGVQVLSGPRTHGTDDPDVEIRHQPGTVQRVRIGAGAWIGANAVVMADVGAHAIVAAGAVVTRPVEPYTVVAGVPARVVSDRRARLTHAHPVSHPPAAVRS
jgi:virginiamycin A acetyltransferase